MFGLIEYSRLVIVINLYTTIEYQKETPIDKEPNCHTTITTIITTLVRKINLFELQITHAAHLPSLRIQLDKTKAFTYPVP